jgi:hypothetical protein
LAVEAEERRIINSPFGLGPIIEAKREFGSFPPFPQRFLLLDNLRGRKLIGEERKEGGRAFHRHKILVIYPQYFPSKFCQLNNVYILQGI